MKLLAILCIALLTAGCMNKYGTTKQQPCTSERPMVGNPSVEALDPQSVVTTEKVSEEVVTRTVIEVREGDILLAGKEKGELFTVTLDTKLLDKDGKEIQASDLQAGQVVEIGYSGIVLEIYPGKMDTPDYIQVIDEGESLVGFYREVLEALYEEDAALNDGITLFAFDLDGVENLSEGEKDGLVYVMSMAHGFGGIRGNFQELCEEGYIDKEKLYFEQGVLFEIKTTKVKEQSFRFNASKWRSGLGAIGWNDCKATKEKGVWQYEVKDRWIS
ncbi:MAG: hypothetical protein ACRDDX_09825 [Cellulosilyticaceae bacterium]